MNKLKYRHIFLVILIILLPFANSCNRNRNPKLQINISGLSSKQVFVSFVGDSISHTDTLTEKGSIFQRTFTPDTSLYKQAVVSYNDGKGFAYFTLIEGKWISKNHLTAFPDREQWSSDSTNNTFYLRTIDEMGHGFMDSTESHLLICYPGQKADSSLTKHLKTDTAGLYLLVLTPVDSIAEKTAKTLEITKDRTCSDESGQITTKILPIFNIHRLPALVSIDSMKRVRRIYIK